MGSKKNKKKKAVDRQKRQQKKQQKSAKFKATQPMVQREPGYKLASGAPSINPSALKQYTNKLSTHITSAADRNFGEDGWQVAIGMIDVIPLRDSAGPEDELHLNITTYPWVRDESSKYTHKSIHFEQEEYDAFGEIAMELLEEYLVREFEFWRSMMFIIDKRSNAQLFVPVFASERVYFGETYNAWRARFGATERMCDLINAEIGEHIESIDSAFRPVGKQVQDIIGSVMRRNGKTDVSRVMFYLQDSKLCELEDVCAAAIIDNGDCHGELVEFDECDLDRIRDIFDVYLLKINNKFDEYVPCAVVIADYNAGARSVILFSETDGPMTQSRFVEKFVSAE